MRQCSDRDSDLFQAPGSQSVLSLRVLQGGLAKPALALTPWLARPGRRRLAGS